MHLFTYGTLMFPEVWQAVIGRQFAAIRGHVFGFVLYRVRDAVFPGMVATTATDRVPGILYLDVDSEAMARLDQFEEEFYRRITVPVACDDGRLREAEAYIVPEARRAELSDEPWSCDAFAAHGDLEQFVKRYRGFLRVGEPQTGEPPGRGDLASGS